MKYKISALLILFSLAVAQEYGSIAGTVIDQTTEQPLPGVNIIILDSDRGAASDGEGHFIIPKLPVGSYHLRAMMIGYENAVKMNVHVNPGRQTLVTFRLAISAVEMQAVEVTRSFFNPEPDVFNSSRTVDYEEVRSDPGGAYDIQKMMQSLPAVVSGADQQNEIIVRGGAPGENLFVMDGIEIPNPNHFGYQGGGGGPINMLNVEFVDQVELIAGAFPAKYGGKASSVMDISLREGNRDEYHLDLDMNMSGIGLMGEGPLAAGRGSFMASFKKSYLDLVIQDIGLSAVPRYWSAQAKVVYDLNPTHKLILNGLYGDDKIDIQEGGYNSAFRGQEIVDANSGQYSLGLMLKSLWNPSTISRLLVYRNHSRWYTDLYNLISDDEKDHYISNHDNESELAVKGDLVKRFSRRLEINLGFQLKRVSVDYDTHVDARPLNINWYSTPTAPGVAQDLSHNQWSADVFPIIANRDTVWTAGDSIWTYVAGSDTVRSFQMGVDTVFAAYDRQLDESFLITNLFAGAKWRPLENITVAAGLHYYGTGHNHRSSVEPRLGFSYDFGLATTLNLSYGVHHQVPTYSLLLGDDSGTSLKNKYTRQLVAGIEHQFGPEVRALVEIYRKDYFDVIATNADTSAYEFDDGGGYNNLGEGYSQGLEIFLQKKLARQMWGTVSYSAYRAFARDLRITDRTEYYNWDFDYRQILTVAGGYKFEFHKQDWFQKLKSEKWYGFISWIPIAPADENEVSLRMRYLGGKPYTPQSYNHRLATWYIDPSLERNTERFPAYFRLDIMFIQRHYFKKSSLVAFVDIQNVFNTDNIWDYRYNADGTRDKILQYKVFPVGGFMLEF